ncbi:hypothetical protein L596_015331 [Steinernema carpocapsae]|uniref:Saposin B-type domain-containing protein n=1 Tax=Steinernema carpocapsae TaxID=34508 RepID=A0A4U5NEM7_STECR|nr:hypothetical protein L596_015331 [Steinernema carpocapsae]
MKLLVFLVAFGLVAVSSVAAENPFEVLRKAVCNSCNDLVTKAEAAHGDGSWIQAHISDSCDLFSSVSIVRKVCRYDLKKVSPALERSVQHQMKPEDACEKALPEFNCQVQ